MQPDEDNIPVAYAIPQNSSVCEIAYVYDEEHTRALVQTQTTWVPINHGEPYYNDDFFKKLFIKTAKVACAIGLIVFALDYGFNNASKY